MMESRRFGPVVGLGMWNTLPVKLDVTERTMRSIFTPSSRIQRLNVCAPVAAVNVATPPTVRVSVTFQILVCVSVMFAAVLVVPSSPA